ncbi:ribosome small subunit-dependent GTPase A [Litorivita sp. NS0012-18]|uniref:ribosome small subunit-dependent GTPase A n=1 Tax=Litorivita sp. NS0012-18 TaxID=3127655 RepID=UPI00333F9AB4
MRSTPHSDTDLGWRAYFANQIGADDGDVAPYRITHLERAGATGLNGAGGADLHFPPGLTTGEVAVGDWVLAHDSGRIARVLDRASLLTRRAAGPEVRPQLIAANVDTLFIVTSCNADFNIARLERYVALALEAETTPVILLTKSDLAVGRTPEDYAAQARGISDRIAAVIVLNSKDQGDLAHLRPWCSAGRTVAFIGSSGVGKSTLINGLTGIDRDALRAQATGGIREDDAKGRHTTTARSLHLLDGGGVLVDMPGMRELGLIDAAAGINTLFEDIVDLAADCRFRDCAHAGEPGCAIGAAIAAGELDAERVERWKKLAEEDNRNTESVGEKRRREKKMSRFHKRVQSESQQGKQGKFRR